METGIFRIAEAKNGRLRRQPYKGEPKSGLVFAEYADDAALHFYVGGRENYWSHL